jgi:hypothetical protein
MGVKHGQHEFLPEPLEIKVIVDTECVGQQSLERAHLMFELLISKLRLGHLRFRLEPCTFAFLFLFANGRAHVPLLLAHGRRLLCTLKGSCGLRLSPKLRSLPTLRFAARFDDSRDNATALRHIRTPLPLHDSIDTEQRRVGSVGLPLDEQTGCFACPAVMSFTAPIATPTT